MNSKALSIAVFLLIVLCGGGAAYYQKHVDAQKAKQLISSRLTDFSQQLKNQQKAIEDKLFEHLLGATRANDVKQAWQQSGAFLQSSYPFLPSLKLISNNNEVVSISLAKGFVNAAFDSKNDYHALRQLIPDDRYTVMQSVSNNHTFIMLVARQNAIKQDKSYVQIAMWDLNQWLLQFSQQHFTAQRLFDLNVSSNGYTLFSTLADRAFAPSDSLNEFTMSTQMVLANQEYTLTFLPKAEFVEIINGNSTFNILLYGTFAVATLMFILIRFDLSSRQIERQSERDQKRLQQEFRQRRTDRSLFRSSIENLANILNSMQIIIITIDEGGTITFVNDFTHSQLGYARDELIGHNISLLMEPDIAREHDHYLYRYMRTGKSRIIGKPRVVRIVKKDKSVFEGQLNIVEIQGVEDKEFLGAVIDVSHQYEMQRVAEETAKRAQQANLSKSRFLANMSHEIRTPLNGIMGALQLIGKKSLTHQQRLYLKAATESSQLLLAIITDVLDLAKIESGKFDLEIAPFDVTKVIEPIVAGQKFLSTEKDFDIDVNYQDDFHSAWYGDATRIGQIVINLLSNAVKFTEHGTILLQVSEFKDVSSNLSGIEIEVQDTGIGMSDATLAKLYQPFSQADSSSTRKYGGTGLGLTITKQIVEAMNGNIIIQSKLGVGTTASVRLPLSKSQLTLTKPSVKNDATDLSNIAGKRILIAEDNEINRLMVKNMLLESGAKVVFATNGNMAIEAVHKVAPDVVLMDIQMPEKDGLSATKEIRAAGFTMPIIAFTANVMKDDITRYRESGFDEYLAKPVEISNLYRLISKVLPRD